ncbi:hypothetical protein T552_01450 [Pneumocystis carinii B80]|uniref:HIT-type domain-containing protein n=1 Tax=Pneumocystis carinii (strain B80) TaxID=1408658 RepID=A0A0W4ZKB7_PNEC8|nr:hypothetical protein T552_01450 [Pneumocystis carinii B80]KTW28820.1 hypothetical protein T552_01450 [Pneumocystis carinii B80]
MRSKECSVCLNEVSKYCCPQCSSRTCSMKCSRQHKVIKSCSGTFNPASFLNKKELLTIQSLDRDYNFLSNVESCLDRSVRYRLNFPSKNHVLRLKKAIERNGIHYFTFPRGMSRATQNKTFWDYKRKKLFWTIEWVYTKNGSKISKIEHKVPSDKNIMEAYKNFIHKTNIKELLDIDHEIVEFMMKKTNSQANNPIFETIDKNKPLSESLKGMTVIEFPTIYITINENKIITSMAQEEMEEKIQIEKRVNFGINVKQNGIIDYDSEE